MGTSLRSEQRSTSCRPRNKGEPAGNMSSKSAFEVCDRQENRMDAVRLRDYRPGVLPFLPSEGKNTEYPYQLEYSILRFLLFERHREHARGGGAESAQSPKVGSNCDIVVTC